MGRLERLVRSRWARIALAGGLLGAGLYAFLPYLTHRVASSAFVNAEIVRVTAPIPGRLAADLPVKGAFIEKETPILLVEALVPDRRQLSVFEQQIAVAQAQVDLAKHQLEEIEAADARLYQRAEAHRHAMVRNLAAEAREAEAEFAACDAERRERQRRLDQAQELARTGVVARRRVEEAQSELDANGARCDAALARHDRLRDELRAARDGVYVRDGGNDTPYSQQQRDRLMLRRQEVQAELLREAARADQLRGEITLERARLESASRYNFELPPGHVVWSVTASPGSAVVEGQELLDLADCRRRFVSVELPERQLENINRGDTAQVRLLGSNTWIVGTVDQMRGSAAHSDGRLLAAQLPKPSSQQVSVDVLLPADGGALDSSRQCDIGRQAEVHFDRGIGGMFALIGRAFAKSD